MIQSGLYVAGNDALTDRAIRVWPRLDAFIGCVGPETIPESFARLRACLEESGQPEPAA
jgi:flagellum-specific ATP synthase